MILRTGNKACIRIDFMYFHVKQTINFYSHNVCDVLLAESRLGYLLSFLHFFPNLRLFALRLWYILVECESDLEPFSTMCESNSSPRADKNHQAKCTLSLILYNFYT